MSRRVRIRLIDTHCGGDLSRVVTGGVSPIPGANVRDKMEFVKHNADGLRQLLLSPPYGTPDMCVDLIVEPGAPGADAGYIIMESMGYPGFSGSNTLCTAAALLESGIVRIQDERQTVILESPAGVSAVVATVRDGCVTSASCDHPDSYVVEYDHAINLPGFGEVTYSIAYSGVFHVLARVADLGLRFEANAKPRFIEAAQGIVRALQGKVTLEHPVRGDVGSELFVHFIGEPWEDDTGLVHGRSATFVQPDVLCHGTTGTGTCARLALLHYEGAAKPGYRFRAIAINGSTLVGTITSETSIGPFRGIKCTVTGAPQVLAYSELIIDLDRCAAPLETLQRILL